MKRVLALYARQKREYILHNWKRKLCNIVIVCDILCQSFIFFGFILIPRLSGIGMRHRRDLAMLGMRMGMIKDCLRNENGNGNEECWE